jgi:hypothetical protein
MDETAIWLAAIGFPIVVLVLLFSGFRRREQHALGARLSTNSARRRISALSCNPKAASASLPTCRRDQPGPSAW